LTFSDNNAPVLSALVYGSSFDCAAVDPVPILTVTDNCDPDPVLNYYSVGESSYEVSTYIVEHYWEYSDRCGNRHSMNHTVNVTDNTPPVMSAVGNLTVPCREIPAVPLVTCIDDCDAHITLEYNQTTEDGTCLDEYILIRTWDCYDNNQLQATRVQTVTVVDDEPPIWTYSPPSQNITIQCDETIPEYLVTAEDVCDYNVVVTPYNSTSGYGCEEVIFLQWTAVDNCGHSIYAEKYITIVDTIAPVLSDYPDHVKTSCESFKAYEGGNIPFWPGTITATDNCNDTAVVKFTMTSLGGDCDDEYTQILTWSATDNCGNNVSHTMSVWVTDKIPPTFDDVPDSYIVSEYEPYATLASIINDAVATDNCDNWVSITGNEHKLGKQWNRDCANEWLIVRYLTATDNCGNTDTHTYKISAIDTTDPVLPDIDDITVECDAYESYNDCDVKPTTTGDEDLDVILTSVTVQLANSYEVRKVWRVTDCAGNSDETKQTITVVDNSDPVFSRVPDEFLNVSCSCDDFPAAPKLKAYDNCDQVSVDYQEFTLDGTCLDEYTLIRSWEAIDSAGNDAVVTQTVEVYDYGNPSWCDEDQSYNSEFQCDEIFEPALPDAKDDCSNVTVVPGEPPYYDEHLGGDECAGEFTRIYPFTAYDDCGNTAETEISINVVDDFAPDLLVDDLYCIFPTYGQEWGMWAVYDLNFLFRHEDNCEGEAQSITQFKCNATESGTTFQSDQLEIGTQQEGNGIEECRIIQMGTDHLVYVQISRETSPPAGVLGRTYNIFAIVKDDCDNEATLKREVFIPLNHQIFEHKQPCHTGPAAFKTSIPQIISGPNTVEYWS
jgi:hypothetical protein